jgi:drug/metabolite transporter (DMT)-like permease
MAARGQGGDWRGPAGVALAALLWATDALFRAPAVQRLDPSWIVCLEHAIATLVLLPWILLRHRPRLFALTPRQWAGLAFVGAGASGAATVLFTASFRFLNPSVAILLQKMQPILVVLTAYAFLGERPARHFYVWAPVALLAALVLTFPDLSLYSRLRGLDPTSEGVVYALSAAAIWAVATTVGRALLGSIPVAVATFWRYVFGLGFLLVLVTVAGRASPVGVVLSSHSLGLSLLYMSLIPGLAALLAYYAGLQRTPASVATFIELLFPVSAVTLNYFFLGSHLQITQVLAGLVLLFAVLRVSSPA